MASPTLSPSPQRAAQPTRQSSRRAAQGAPTPTLLPSTQQPTRQSPRRRGSAAPGLPALANRVSNAYGGQGPAPLAPILRYNDAGRVAGALEAVAPRSSRAKPATRQTPAATAAPTGATAAARSSVEERGEAVALRTRSTRRGGRPLASPAAEAEETEGSSLNTTTQLGNVPGERFPSADAAATVTGKTPPAAAAAADATTTTTTTTTAAAASHSRSPTPASVAAADEDEDDEEDEEEDDEEDEDEDEEEQEEEDDDDDEDDLFDPVTYANTLANSARPAPAAGAVETGTRLGNRSFGLLPLWIYGLFAALFAAYILRAASLYTPSADGVLPQPVGNADLPSFPQVQVPRVGTVLESVSDSIKNTRSTVKRTGSSVWSGLAATVDWFKAGADSARRLDLENQIRRLEESFRETADISNVHQKSLDELKSMLPKLLIVEKKDGDFEIPEQFWPALKQKLDFEKSGTPDARSWEEFVESNDRRILELQNRLSRMTNEEAMGSSTFVDADDFSYLVGRSYAGLREEVKRAVLGEMNAEIQRMRDELVAGYYQLTRERIFNAYENIPRQYLNGLAASRARENEDVAIRRVNFFSYLLGARVNPNLSSDTYVKKSDTFYQRMYKWWARIRENPPSSALIHWNEAGDCWCASKYKRPRNLKTGYGELDPHNVKGPFFPDGTYNPEHQAAPKAQLTVIMPNDIYPNSVSIEHLPREGTLHPHAAPDTLELWVQVDDAKMIPKLTEVAKEKVKWHSGPRLTKREEGIPLGEHHVLVARWRYDLFAENHVQTHWINIDFKELGISIKTATVRAVSNWGSEDFTCFYRIRMHGEATGERPTPTKAADYTVTPEPIHGTTTKASPTVRGTPTFFWPQKLMQYGKETPVNRGPRPTFNVDMRELEYNY